MYLADKAIRSQLTRMQITVPGEFAEFDPETQIQPCSIDLRLGWRFWSPRRGLSIDLRRSKLLEVAPRRRWKERNLRSGESILLVPGAMLLSHTLEQFSIPPNCAGKIEGRSSYARLGLQIHCAADFINPGYRGRMSMQLVNLGKVPIKLFPELPVCQLVLVALSEVPSRLYGDMSLSSKYNDDDGGPSYWWRDHLLRSVLEKMKIRDVATTVQEEIVARIGLPDYDVLRRLEGFVARSRTPEMDSADQILDNFALSEDRKRKLDELARRLPVGAFVVLLGATISVAFVQPFRLLHYLLWLATGVSAVGAWIAAMRPSSNYLGSKELDQIGRPAPVATGQTPISE
ncbi:dCTP deaminase [Micromonospora sp. WMMD1128]|uniref:dCTP deaminase n=1 Tax=Micromonospora sp. WMMD1128 TaxID=3015150 RepID=UPI00248CA6BF|nr:dCTP deaminase [Micromonospora sp. WMMD1128]WBB74743.1 dCTP deaminase [Micromonospora sp. WMMD1128]